MALSRAAALGVVTLTLSACYQPTRTSVVGLTSGMWSKDAAALAPLSSNRLSLSDAIARARAQSADIVARRAELQARKAEVDASAKIDNPELRVGQLRLDQLTHDQPEVEVKLRVKPPRPIENDARKAEAEAAVRAAEADLAESERELAAATRLAYYEAASLGRSIAATKAVVAVLAKRAALTDQNAAASHATGLDLALAGVDKANMDAELSVLVGERRRALGRLSDATGLALPDDVELDPVDFDAFASLELPDEAKLVELGLRAAPELEQRAAEIDAAAALADQERASQLPWFSFLELGYQFSPQTIDPEGFTFGAGVVLPVFDTRAAAIDAAEANKTALTRRLESDAKTIRAAVRDARRELEAAQRALGSERAAIREASKKAVAEAKRGVASSTLDELSALKIELDAAKLGMDDTKALQRLLVALAELERLTGFEPKL